MNLCDRNISNSESRASERIGSIEEENANVSEKLNLQIVEGDCTRNFQLAFKREPEYSNHFMKDVKNEKELERIKILSNFQIEAEDCDPELLISLKQEPDHKTPIIRNNAGQNELELNHNSSNYEILNERALEYQVIFKTDPDQNNLVIKDIKNEGEFSEISSNFQIVEEEGVADFRVNFKTEPELDIGIDCNDEQLKCSACLKQFQSLDMFRGHIVSDHLEENICKLCNEEFECSQFEHSAKHLSLVYEEHMEIEENEKFRHGETSTGHTKAILKDEFLKKPGFQCIICSKVFIFRYRLVKHMRTHTGEKPFECKLSPEKFGGNTALLCHKRIKHTNEFISDDKPVPYFQCIICYKAFGMEGRLRDHMRVHTGEKPFQCKLCPEQFKKNSELLCHRRTKHTDKFISDNKPVPDFQCSICHKAFGIKYRLKEHMRTHTGEKPYDCELCPEKFASSGGLLIHRRTMHTDKFISNDKPIPDFQCSICNKVFGLKCRLRVHMRIHTDEKPFDCELCPKKFVYYSALIYHKRTKHADEFISDDKPVPDFQCSICYKVFGMKSRLRNHMRQHEKPFQCKLCSEKFQCNDAFKIHVQTKHTDQVTELGL